MSYVADAHFQHILRVFNTNINGKEKVVFALAAIRGIGPRLACVICKKANIDTRRRAGELKPEEIEKVIAIMQNPAEFKIPVWMLNRQKDIKDGTNSQVLSNGLDSKFRDDLEMLKKMKNHRGLRHSWGLRVRGQHTKTTGRHGRTVGVSKKKNP